MLISGCHDLPLATFNLPSRVFRHGCRRAECPKRRWGGFFHTLSSARPAQRIKPSTLTPSCRHSVAACVSDHSRGQALTPATALRTNGNNTQTIVIPEFSFRASGMEISGISRASGPERHGKTNTAGNSFTRPLASSACLRNMQLNTG